MELWQSRERWPVLVVAIKGSGADCASLQLLATPNLVGKPMQAIRCVWCEILEGRHLADFRRNANQTAAIENKVFNGFQFGDARRKRRDLCPLFRRHLWPRREFVATVTSRVINQFIEALPRGTLRVLCFDVDLQLGPFRAVSRDNAVARGLRNGVGTGFPSPEVLENTRFV